MEIILLEKIQNLGGLGETVKVKPGYARNFLVPQGKALPANEANLRVFEERRAELEAQQATELQAAQTRAKAIETVTLRLERRAGDGRLFGSVGVADIAEAITEAGQTVHRSEVRLPEGPIRQTGRFEAIVRVHPDVEATVPVTVVTEGQAEEDDARMFDEIEPEEESESYDYEAQPEALTSEPAEADSAEDETPA